MGEVCMAKILVDMSENGWTMVVMWVKMDWILVKLFGNALLMNWSNAFNDLKNHLEKLEKSKNLG